MAILQVLELIALLAIITAAVWAIGRQGLEMGDVFGTLFTNGPRSRPTGQEDDDTWERIRAERGSRPKEPPAGDG